MNTNGYYGKPDTTVQSVLTLATSTYGVKRGIARAAELLGVSERWVKSFRFGEPARVSADTFIRALEARQALALERAAQLRAEIAELDQIARTRPDDEVQTPGVLGPITRGEACDVGRRAPHSGRGMAHQTA